MLPDTDAEAIADAVLLLVQGCVGPLVTRLAVAEEKLAAAVEQTKDLGLLRERLAVLETRPLTPGPPGPPGKDGVDGAPGTAGMTYQGVFQDGKSYEKGDVVTWAGQMYHCQKDATTAKPEEFSRDWQLCVKRGRDAK